MLGDPEMTIGGRGWSDEVDTPFENRPRDHREATEKIMYTRRQLAKRWECNERTVDRMREQGLIPWVDLSQGRGPRARVRFLLRDIEEIEKKNRKEI